MSDRKITAIYFDKNVFPMSPNAQGWVLRGTDTTMDFTPHGNFADLDKHHGIFTDQEESHVIDMPKGTYIMEVSLKGKINQNPVAVFDFKNLATGLVEETLDFDLQKYHADYQQAYTQKYSQEIRQVMFGGKNINDLVSKEDNVAFEVEWSAKYLEDKFDWHIAVNKSFWDRLHTYTDSAFSPVYQQLLHNSHKQAAKMTSNKKGLSWN